MRKIICILAVTFLFILGACSNGEKDNKENSTDPVMIDVKVRTEPKTLNAGEKAKVVATVSQGGEKVEDAEKVQFEIWKEGTADNEHDKMEAKHSEGGNYPITYRFKEKGKYFIIAHTYARNLHTMPKIQVDVR